MPGWQKAIIIVLVLLIVLMSAAVAAVVVVSRKLDLRRIDIGHGPRPQKISIRMRRGQTQRRMISFILPPKGES